MKAIIDLWMLYQYDNTILDNLHLPDSLDADTVKDNLLLECAEQELLYTEPGFLKNAIDVWSTKQLPVWDKLAATLNFDYNPIENYNMEETEAPAETTETTTPAERTERVTPAETSLEITPAEITETTKPYEQTVKNTNQAGVYGFNSAQSRPSDTNAGEQTNVVNAAGTVARTTQESELHHSTTDTPESRVYTTDTPETHKVVTDKERTLRRSGNIGVTTTQHMIAEEREIAIFNMVDTIIKDFKMRFVLSVY